ncbi:MAG: hypothetical protein HKL96_09505 [Phycisphaerales bacterium]|nr:hypothetical protein [Phycisphaerales bacterium]
MRVSHATADSAVYFLDINEAGFIILIMNKLLKARALWQVAVPVKALAARSQRWYFAAISVASSLLLAGVCQAQIKKLAPEYPKVGKLNGHMPPYLVGGLLFFVIVLVAFRSARRSKQSES